MRGVNEISINQKTEYNKAFICLATSGLALERQHEIEIMEKSCFSLQY